MIDPERIQRLAAKMGNRKDALEMVHQMRCGGKKYPDGGKFFRTNLQQESPLMYQPMMPSYPDVPVPMRYKPLPNYGSYEYPASTGMMESMPIATPADMLASVHGDYVEPVPVEPAVDLFSDEAIARRALKQRYAESAFNDKAKSRAGAQGAWQIMPITLKDYLGRGRGKAGDLNDPEYNRKVRDWVMDIIPRDLQEFWSDSDSDRAKLAKLYAAYNWGAGNLRGFLRKKQKAGVDISDPDNWVDDLNPETRRYVKYLAFDEDIPDSTVYTNAAFERAAADRGFAGGGRIHIKPENRGKFNALLKRTGKSASWFKEHGTPLQRKRATFALNARKWKHGDGGLLKNYFEDGGPEKQNWFTRATLGAMMAENPAVATASGWTRDADGNVVQTEQDNPGVQQLRNNLAVLAGASYAAPLLSSAPAAVNWLSNPANQILAAKFAVPMLGAEAVNSAVRNYTPYNSWGEGLYSPFRRFNEKYLPGIPNWVNETGEFLADFTNPGFVVAPYAGEIGRNIAKGAKDLYNWGRFVTGNGKEYSTLLRRMKDLQDAAGRKGAEVSSLRNVVNNYEGLGSYMLPVTTETVTVPNYRSSLDRFPSEMEFTPSIIENPVKIQRTIEDLGLGSSGASLTYPVAGESLAPGETTFVSFRPKKDVYATNRYNWFSDAAGNGQPFADEVLDPIVGFRSTATPEMQGALMTFKTSGASTLPVQRGVKGGGSVVKKSLEKTEGMLGDAGFVSGSTPLYANDYLSGVPGDTEVVTTMGRLQDTMDRLGVKNATKINDFAYRGKSADLPQGGKVDIQVVEQTDTGEATGNLAWSLYRTMHPEEYYRLVNDYAPLRNAPFTEYVINNPATNAPYTPDELIKEFTDGNFKMQQLINDAMGMNKNVRNSLTGVKEENILKHNRPISFLTSKDPEMKVMVRKALDTNAMAELGPNYMHGHEYFPNIDFTDVEANTKFLKSMNIKPDGIADDPEMMENIFDAWFMPETSQVRVVSGKKGKKSLLASLFEGNHSYGGGDLAGSGLNTLSAGSDIVAFDYESRGIMQNLPSYRETVDNITNTADAKALTARLSRKRQLSTEENKALSDELKSIIKEMEDAGVKKYELDVVRDAKKQMPTAMSMQRLDDILRDIGSRLDDPYAADIIDRLARTIDVPVIKTSGYSGRYVGKLRSGAPRAVSMKNSSGTFNGFEVGRNLHTYAETGAKGDTWTGPGAYSEAPFSAIPEYKKNLVNAIESPNLHNLSAKELQDMGAEFIPNLKVEQLQTLLQEMRDEAWSHQNIADQVERYNRMPLSFRARREAGERVGLRYNRFNRRVEKDGRAVPSPKEGDKILRDAMNAAKKMPGSNFDLLNENSIKRIVRSQANGNWLLMVDDYVGYEFNPETGVVEMLDLPFANGGFLNKLKSAYGEDAEKIRNAIANARARQKK